MEYTVFQSFRHPLLREIRFRLYGFNIDALIFVPRGIQPQEKSRIVYSDDLVDKTRYLRDSRQMLRWLCRVQSLRLNDAYANRRCVGYVILNMNGEDIFVRRGTLTLIRHEIGRR